MTLTSTVNDKSIKEVTYPCLKHNGNGRVVMFSSSRVGTVICNGSGDIDDLGMNYDHFTPSLWEPFTGSVTLTQE